MYAETGLHTSLDFGFRVGSLWTFNRGTTYFGDTITFSNTGLRGGRTYTIPIR